MALDLTGLLTWQLGAIALCVWLLVNVVRRILSVGFGVDVNAPKLKKLVFPLLAVVLGAGLGALSSLIDGAVLDKAILGAIAGDFCATIHRAAKAFLGAKSDGSSLPPSEKPKGTE